MHTHLAKIQIEQYIPDSYCPTSIASRSLHYILTRTGREMPSTIQFRTGEQRSGVDSLGFSPSSASAGCVPLCDWKVRSQPHKAVMRFNREKSLTCSNKHCMHIPWWLWVQKQHCKEIYLSKVNPIPLQTQCWSLPIPRLRFSSWPYITHSEISLAFFSPSLFNTFVW